MVSMLIAHAGRDAWLSIICAWAADVTLAIVYAYMAKRFPGESMIQYSMSVLGKYFGRVVGGIFALFFLMASAVLIRSLCSLLKTEFFPETPINVLIASCFLLIAFGTKKGLKVFARVTAFLGPIYLISFIFLGVSVVPFVKVNDLKPLLVKGAFPFLSGSPFILSFISICIIMGMFTPYCNKPKDSFKGKFIAVTMGSIMLELEAILSICIFGPKQAGDTNNAGLQLAHIVTFGNTFERLEVIFLIVSVAAGVMAVISLMWAFSLGVSQLTGLSSYKSIVYPSALLAFVISVTSFDSSMDIFNFVNHTFPFLALFVESGIECFLFVVALIFKKKGNAK